MLTINLVSSYPLPHYSLRDAITKKNLHLFGKSPNDLDPPYCIFGILQGTVLLDLFLDALKFLNMFEILSSSPIFLGKRPN